MILNNINCDQAKDSSSIGSQKQIEIIEAKLTKTSEDEKWFFQRHEVLYDKIAIQIITTSLMFYSIYHYPLFQHYKTTVWGEQQ